jgi:hypothetical protein
LLVEDTVAGTADMVAVTVADMLPMGVAATRKLLTS